MTEEWNGTEYYERCLFSLAKIGAGDGDRPAGALDLLDTLKAYAHECVGMAANMIGVRKRIII